MQTDTSGRSGRSRAASNSGTTGQTVPALCGRRTTMRAFGGGTRTNRVHRGATNKVATWCTCCSRLHYVAPRERQTTMPFKRSPGSAGDAVVCVRACVRACVRGVTPQHGIAARSRWRCRALRGPPAQGTRSAVFTVKAEPPPRRSYDATCSGRAGPPRNMECAACRAEDGVRRRGERTPTRPCCVRAMHRRGNDARETRAAYSISALTR